MDKNKDKIEEVQTDDITSADTEKKDIKKKIIIISSIVASVVIIGLISWFIVTAINKGKEFANGVSDSVNNIAENIPSLELELTSENETTGEDITTSDITTETTTSVVDNETTDEETTTENTTSSQETTTKKQETTTVKPTTTQKETTTKKQETTTQKPTEQETTTQAPVEEDNGWKFDESTGKLTIWGEDMLYYDWFINTGTIQVIPWESYKGQKKLLRLKKVLQR